MSKQKIVTVSELSVIYHSKTKIKEAVRDVSFTIEPGEVVALAGESGSGKTTIGKTLIGLLPLNAVVTGHASIEQTELIGLHRERDWTSIRRKSIGYIPQDPGASLNPTIRIGKQVEEAFTVAGVSRYDAKKQAIAVLHEVGFPNPAKRYNQYPYELSGGLSQRVLIAIAIARSPKFIVADEPTSSLDVTVQAVIIQLLKDLVRTRNIALLMITHDLSVARKIADRVLVMKQGKLVESGDIRSVLSVPHNPYTKKLVEAFESFEFDADKSEAQTNHDRNPVLLSYASISKDFGSVKVLENIDLSIHEGETLGIVGESGSGKSTLLRLALGLEKPSQGHVSMGGKRLDSLTSKDLRSLRPFVQLVQQNPYSSVDPRYTVLQTVAEPLVRQRSLRVKECIARVKELLKQVDLDQSLLELHPRDLSGGQIQRIALARALACEPRLLLLDEPVSALDVVVQARVIALLARLKQELRLTYVFVSHDIGVIQNIADRIAVIHHGRIVETGSKNNVLTAPVSPYTKELISAIP